MWGKVGKFLVESIIFGIAFGIGISQMFIFIRQNPIIALLVSIFYILFQTKEFKDLIYEKSYLAISVRALLSVIVACFVGGLIWTFIFLRTLNNSDLVTMILCLSLSVGGSLIFNFIRIFKRESAVAKKSKQIVKGLYKMKILHDNSDQFAPKL